MIVTQFWLASAVATGWPYRGDPVVGAVGEMASTKRHKLWKTGEGGLCCSSSAIQTRLGPSSLLEEQSKAPIVFVVLLCCQLPPKLGETAKVYRIERSLLICKNYYWLSFFTFSTIQSIERILHWSKKPTSRFWWISMFWGPLSPKTVIFGMSSVSVCLSVCVSICGHYNSKSNWASSTKFGMLSYMIQILAGIAFEQNRPTGVASALIAIFFFFFFCKKWLKNVLYKKLSRQKLLQITIHNFWCNNCFDCPTGLASTLIAQFVYLAKSALKIRCTKKKKFSDKSCYKSKSATFMLWNIFRYLPPLWSYSGFSDYVVWVCRESIVPSYGTDFHFF